MSPALPTSEDNQARPRADETGAVLRFEDVTLSFSGVPVLEGISFAVAPGETKVLLGETGAGKSLILKLALGLLRPDGGRIFLLGNEVTALSEDELFPLRRHVGMVFQESALFDSLTVRENVAYPLEQERHADAAAIEERVRACLQFVELEATLDKRPDELSGGMRRRVAIARALAAAPAVMLYDSPTGGLDPVTATTIVELIIRLRDARKVSSLLVTHRLQDAALMATHAWDQARGQLRPADPDHSHTRFLLLRARRLAFEGDARALLAIDDPYIRRYLA